MTRKSTYLALLTLAAVYLVWASVPSLSSPTVEEMANTFTASVTTPHVCVYNVSDVHTNDISGTSLGLRYSVKVTIPHYSGRVFLAAGEVPLGANPCTYLPSSFSPGHVPPAVYSGWSSRTYVVTFLNSTVYAGNQTFRASFDAVSTPNGDWVVMEQTFDPSETPVLWIVVIVNGHAYRIGTIEFVRVGEGLLYLPKVMR
ncbi:hypothetical protein HS1genome_1730 [Sulfodiicoccus acidiphilus]|uniref:Uncharacterized protein n=1 Tax=Sulfodiicoccus acidiphilus TaxID=1670455 RepID=A0A348B589_9CREN|nr:hypothetical protein [Sulfodiicoccus acidiphilus]BBD73341.1 hypothetical protein HS1genome_1730 [Sulfodiicoccus acidiphilus]GGT88979.1 hypothetical protein GCM10007116_03500 [Sulfodiicoccus acidiphilus]